MTDKQTKGRRTTKAERLLALARDLYEPRKATRWPYLLRDGEQFKFEGPDRRRLQADLRAAWRKRYPAEAAPAAPDLNAVADDLRHLAERAEPDPAGTDDQAAEIISAHGISEVPQDRGWRWSPGERTAPARRLYHPRAVHRRGGRHSPDERRRDRARPCRLVMAVPRPRLRRPGRRPAR